MEEMTDPAAKQRLSCGTKRVTTSQAWLLAVSRLQEQWKR